MNSLTKEQSYMVESEQWTKNGQEFMVVFMKKTKDFPFIIRMCEKYTELVHDFLQKENCLEILEKDDLAILIKNMDVHWFIRIITKK